MGDPAELEAAYRLLNNPQVSMEALLKPHHEHTLHEARERRVVLWIQDTTELDYTRYRQSKKGLGIIGDGNGYGMLLHSTLGVDPDSEQVLGLGDVQAFLRTPKEEGKKSKGWRGTPEGECWKHSAQAIGAAPEGVTWVHVADREGDNFEFWATCLALNQHFLVRIERNRLCWVGEQGEEKAYLMDYARSLEAQAEHTFELDVPAHHGQAARRARLQVAWGKVVVGPSAQAPKEIRQNAPFTAWVLRVWESDPPEGVEAIEWVLLTSLPVSTYAQGREKIEWYKCRWLCEDYHQCLKTGCRIERTQLDDVQDIQRLLGFLAPIAVRLLQLRQRVRQQPEGLAQQHLDPWMVKTLARLTRQDERTMTVQDFWYHVARMGGFLWRKGDGQPGWRTLWRGWKYLADLTRGARLFGETADTS